MFRKWLSALLSISMLMQGMSWNVLANELESIEEMEEVDETFYFGFASGQSPYNSIRDNEVMPLQGTSEQKIAALKSMFPQGRYWNHPASERKDYWPESTTQTVAFYN